MPSQDTAYDLTLALAMKYSPASALELWRAAGGGRAIWEHRREIAELIPDIAPKGSAIIRGLDAFLPAAEQEIERAEAKGIRCISIADSDYPTRLKACNDAPLVIFYKGTADLNARRILSVVGTRRCTDYGRSLCASITAELAQACPGLVVVSGLAYGIDINAHRGALAAGLPTIGVLAHGLDRIYPAMHRTTARQMEQQGGLFTEFPMGTSPDKQNFVRRNRIIAGLADATLVVESAAKGGGLITASMALSYDREVLACPGRASDEFSEGCNKLIADQKAQLVSSGYAVAEYMGWAEKSKAEKRDQAEPQLFPEMSDDEQKLADALAGSEGKPINTLFAETGISAGKISALLLGMETRGIVKSLNGGLYRLEI